MKTAATLRFASKINSSVPSRIVKADLSAYGRSGLVAITFDYQGQQHTYKVPFTRPYLNKEKGDFANLLNLNQSRRENNEVFQELVAQITANYTLYPQLEVPCVIEVSV